MKGTPRERVSVVLVFGGFAVLVLVFRGTWANAWHALIGSKGSTPPASSSGAPSSARQASLQLQPGSFGLEYPTPAAHALPGSPPTPARASGPAHPLITGTSGDIAGAPGENVFHYSDPSQNKVWAFHGGYQGPGTYQAEKFTDPFHGGTTGTELVRVGP